MKPNQTKLQQLIHSGATSCNHEGGKQSRADQAQKKKKKSTMSNTYLGHFTLQDTAKKKRLILQYWQAEKLAQVRL